MIEDKNKPIIRAQIYKTEFEVEGNKYIYVGQDSKCEEDYYGSSLVIYHYLNIFGEEVFSKTILEERNNISLKELCSLEQEYIFKEKEECRKNNRHFSLNYTGENRRDSSPPLDVDSLAGKIISAADKLGLKLKLSSLSRGCIKPVNPPHPFNSGGMHIETNYGLRRIGFSFLEKNATNENIGLARHVLRELGMEGTLNSHGSYQLIMSIHNRENPEEIASLFKELVNVTSKLFGK